MASFPLLVVCAADAGSVIEESFVNSLVIEAGAASSAISMLIGLNAPYSIALDVWREYQNNSLPNAPWRTTVASQWRVPHEWETTKYVAILCHILDKMMLTEDLINQATARTN